MADGNNGASPAELGLTVKDLVIKPESQESSPQLPVEQLKSMGLDSYEKLSAIATDENFLGEGGNASVFAIPGSEQYVVRIQHRAWTAPTEGDIEPVEDPLPDINVGQAVARMGNVFILKRQEGVPAGLTHADIKRLGLTHEAANADYLQRTSLAASLPQQAYDELAELLEILNEKGYNFDPSKPNNILVDTEKQKFNLVDLDPRDPNSDYRNNLTSMVIPLMNNSYAWKVEDPDMEQQLASQRGAILDKAIQASIKAKLPIPDEQDSSLNYSFKMANKEGQWSAQRQVMISTPTTSSIVLE